MKFIGRVDSALLAVSLDAGIDEQKQYAHRNRVHRDLVGGYFFKDAAGRQKPNENQGNAKFEIDINAS